MKYLMTTVFVLFLFSQSCYSQDAILDNISLPHIITKIKNSVVWIQIGTNEPTKFNFGTGFIGYIDSMDSNNTQGFVAIITANHLLFKQVIVDSQLIIPDTSQIRITFNNNEESLEATFLGHREDKDIAIIGIRLPDTMISRLSISPVSFGAVRNLQEGIEVGCTGYDLTRISRSFSQTYRWAFSHRGIVSLVKATGPKGKGQIIDNFVADMMINMGSSGSPVYLTSTGEVVGMVRSFKKAEHDEVTQNSGLATCVPSWAIILTLREAINSRARSLIK